ncbi:MULTISPECIES: DUF6891 domain-containing protein [unclassified Streptomyces]|uniref:DUF6891 domain-containing protein n=1 Tax=unclassified Streptomyces TaxID=2593676 RepID=UPI0034146F9B
MLAITVDTENGRRHSTVTAAQLADLVRQIGAEGDRFLVLQRIPDRPDVFVQVWHESEATGIGSGAGAGSGSYTLEYRDGAYDRHFRATLGSPDPVIAAMTGWARARADWNAGLEWERMEFEPPAAVPELDLTDEDRELLETHVRQVMTGGYATRAELAELAEDYLVSDGVHPISLAQAQQLVDRIWLERVAEQATWQGETDPERLTRAFAALEATGITARENFTCCRSCGQSEIGAAGSPQARGFVYFHSQSTDAAASGHGLTLHYGGFDGLPETAASVGREVVAAVERCGLSVEWDGDPGRALDLTPLDWRKRLTG